MLGRRPWVSILRIDTVGESQFDNLRLTRGRSERERLLETIGSVTCPNDQRSNAWSEQTNGHGKSVIQVKFKPSTCCAGADQAKCTHSARGARNRVLQPQAQNEALQQVRRTQKTNGFRKAYAKRSGIESTPLQVVRTSQVHQARYRGIAKTHLKMIASAVVINLHRLFDWWRSVPRSLTRVSPFASLAPTPALVRASWRT